MRQDIRSNFDMLRAYEPQLWRLGALAKRYSAEDDHALVDGMLIAVQLKEANP